MRILRLDMGRLSAGFEDLPDGCKALGGRGLAARLLTAELDPAADPLGPMAKLVFACGPLAGTMAPSFGRLSVVAKSPLTLGLRESNAGGSLAQKLDKLGIRAILIEGAPESGALFTIHIDKDGVRFDNGARYRGLGNYQLVDELRAENGAKVGVISIGPAGERLNRAAALALTDKAGDSSRQAARGGLGAVLGAKGIKAIIVDESGMSAITPVQQRAYREAVKPWAKILKQDPIIQVLSDEGTPGFFAAAVKEGRVPVNDFSGADIDHLDRLTGKQIRADTQARGGGMEACMQGCLIKCSAAMRDASGSSTTSSVQYGNLVMLGTNLGLSDADAIASLVRRCQDLGLDPVEIGGALGVASSSGSFVPGDIDAIHSLFDQIEAGTGLGAVMAEGLVATAAALGVTRVPAMGSLAIPGRDPRVDPLAAIAYQTNPMGADAVTGPAPAALGDDLLAQSLKDQIYHAMIDSLGLCQFALPADRGTSIEFLRTLTNTCHGLELSGADLIGMGRATLRDELAFNARSGFRAGTAEDFLGGETLPLSTGMVLLERTPDSFWEQLDSIALP